MAQSNFDPTPENTDRKPFFALRDLPPSRQLTYRLLNWANYEELYHLFKSDENPFVDPRFKYLREVRDYAEYQLEYAWFSPKRAGCDWFFLKDNQYAGVIHLYDLSLETYNNRHRRCTIGFATAAPFRRQQLTSEAVRQLLDYVFNGLQMQRVNAHTLRENQASVRFLTQLGFTHCPVELINFGDPNKYHYFGLEQEAFKRSLL